MQDCLFCKIIDKKVPATVCYEDQHTMAFDDLYPKAPHHQLIIPKKHIATLNDLNLEDINGVGHLVYVAKLLAKELGMAEKGYRVVMNCNQAAGQAVYHIHLHLLGGRSLSWPPG